MKPRTKNILLIASFLCVLFLGYKLAISKTIALKREYNRLSAQETLYENIPKQLSFLHSKENYYDSILQKYKLNETSLQNNLLKSLNVMSDSLNFKVIKFNEPHTFSSGSGQTQNTYHFSLEGGFESVLTCIYQLEQHYKFGEITHVQFLKQKNYRTQKDYLQAEIFIQRFQ